LVSTADLSTGLPDLAAWDPIAGRLTGTVDSATPETMILPLRSGRIVVMAVPRPLPLDTVTNDLGQRVVWPGCDQARAGWASHIIVGSLHEVSDLAHARDTAEDVVRVAQALVYAIPVEAVS